VRWTFRRRARCRRARASPPATRWRMTRGADRNSRNSRSQPPSPRCDGGRYRSTAASASRRAAAARPSVPASALAIVGRHAEKATVTKSRYSRSSLRATSGGPRLCRRTKTASTPGAGAKSLRRNACRTRTENHGAMRSAASVIWGRPAKRCAASRCRTRYVSRAGVSACMSFRRRSAVMSNGGFATMT
jgi:hypothetical protein